VAVLYAVYILMLRQATSAAGAGTAVAAPLFEATAGAVVGSALLGLVLDDVRLGPPWPALGWIVLLALSSQVIGWLLITVSMPRLAAGTIGALLLIQPAGSVALSYVILGERPSLLQLAGVALVLTGVVVAVTGRAPDAGRAPEAGYSRRRTRIIRHASAASTGTSPSKSP
jgi:drug/metabolite transporter (DMT)-like permease